MPEYVSRMKPQGNFIQVPDSKTSSDRHCKSHWSAVSVQLCGVCSVTRSVSTTLLGREHKEGERTGGWRRVLDQERTTKHQTKILHSNEYNIIKAEDMHVKRKKKGEIEGR
jgi:uncharacterized membrane protein